MPAEAPKRSTASATIGWGILSIPVSLYSGTEKTGVSRKEFTADGHEVGRKPYDKVTGADVTQDQIVKRFQCPDGSLVDLTDDEISAVVQTTPGQMTIEGFLPSTVMSDGTYVVDNVMQARPAKRQSGKAKVEDPAAQKAFTLLLNAMTKEKVVALVSFTLRGAQRYGIITPDGRLSTILFDEGVREDLPLPDSDISKDELEMGRKLIGALKLDTPPVVSDEASKKIVEYAVAKAAGGDTAEVVEAAPVEQVGDLMSLLEASLSEAA